MPLEVRHSRMFVSGIQAGSELDPRLRHSGDSLGYNVIHLFFTGSCQGDSLRSARPMLGLFSANVAQQLFPFCIFFLVLLHGHTGFGIVALEWRFVDCAVETEFPQDFLPFGT
jgi:hypothetical protein